MVHQEFGFFATKELDKEIEELKLQLNSLTLNSQGEIGSEVETGLWTKFLAFLKGLGVEIKQNFVKLDNLITNTITARKVQIEELCVGDVCVTREQFLQIVQDSGINPPYTTHGETAPIDKPLEPDPKLTPQEP